MYFAVMLSKLPVYPANNDNIAYTTAVQQLILLVTLMMLFTKQSS